MISVGYEMDFTAPGGFLFSLQTRNDLQNMFIYRFHSICFDASGVSCLEGFFVFPKRREFDGFNLVGPLVVFKGDTQGHPRPPP